MHVNTKKCSQSQNKRYQKPLTTVNMIPSCDLPRTSQDSSFDSDSEFELTDTRRPEKQKHVSAAETPVGKHPKLKRVSKDRCFVEDYISPTSKTVPSQGNMQQNVFSPEAKLIRSKIKDLELLCGTCPPEILV